MAVAIATILVSSSERRIVAQESSPSSTKLSRIERLRAWMAAVNRHDPGSLDDEVSRINTWGTAELRQVWIDVSSVVSLVRDPGIRQFWIPAERPTRPQGQGTATANRPTQTFYSGSELRALLEMAEQLGPAAGQRENLLLKKGAMLHADVAMLAPAEARSSPRGSPGSQRYRLKMDDGQPGPLRSEVNHWDMGRRLLDLVRARDAKISTARSPASDDDVRLWYVATCAHLLWIGDLDPQHFDRGLELFPKDPDILFVNGALHEAMAGARRQAAMRAADVPNDVTFDFGSRPTELAKAERLYERLLEVAPAVAEARIHYGRVLGQRGHHEEAVAELQRGTAAANGPLLEYYAALFLAGELEALGKDGDAARAYERAVTLVPTAQSPRLGLSRLAEGGEHAAAREALLTLAAQPAEGDARDDPWWSYDISPGRGAELAFNMLHDRLRSRAR